MEGKRGTATHEISKSADKSETDDDFCLQPPQSDCDWPTMYQSVIVLQESTIPTLFSVSYVQKS